MNVRPAQNELAQLVDFQRRQQVSLVCLVFVEVVGSAQLKQQLGDAAAIRLLRQHDQVLRDLLGSFSGGLEVRGADGSFFLVFDKPSDAVRFAMELQGRIGTLARKAGQALQDRVGIHVGEVLVEVPEGESRSQGFNGIQVDIAQAVLSLAGPGRILLTRFAYENARQSLKAGPGAGDLAWASHGLYTLEGFDEPIELCEVAARSRAPLTAPKGNDRARRADAQAEGTALLGDTGATETTFRQRQRTASRGEKRAALAGAAVVAVAGALFLVLRLLDGLSYDLAYLFRRASPPSDVVIVEMDENAFTFAGPKDGNLWDRRQHARLVDRLTAAGVRAIGFDVWFDTPSEEAIEKGLETPADTALRDAFKKNGRTVIGAYRDLRTKHAISTVNPPSPYFRPVARFGVVEKTSASDTIRLMVRGSAGIAPFGQILAEVATGRTNAGPVDGWLNYYGPPQTIARQPYLWVLNEATNLSSLSNKVVLIGSTVDVPPFKDNFKSPYSAWRPAQIPGVEVNATSLANLIHGDWLRRLPPLVEFFLVLLVGAGAGYGLVFFEPARVLVIGLGAAAAVGLGLMLQVWVTRYWFPWLVVSGVELPLAVAWAVAVRTRVMAADDRRLRKFIATHRPTAAGAAGAAGAEAGAPRGVKSPAAAMAGAAPTLLPGAPGPTGAGPVSPVALATLLPGGAEPTLGGPTSLMTAEQQRRAGQSLPAVPDHEMIRCIGAGAYGEVWLARDVIGSYHAVKILRRDKFADSGPFEREFRGLQKYTPISRSHPGLVHILHVGRNEAAGFIYYIMEAGDDAEAGAVIDPETYVPRTLASDIDRLGRLPLPEVARHGVAVAEALGFLHRNQLIHRDLKPANIIFARGRPKLADIGLVTDISAPGHESTFVGTHGYMPAEGPGAPSADVFSLGRLLYVALTGRPPKEFPDLPREVTEGPDAGQLYEFVEVLKRAAEPVVQERFQNAGDLLDALRPFCPAEPPTPRG